MSKILEAWTLLETALSWQGAEDERLNVFLSELTKSGYLLDYGDIVAARITNAFLRATKGEIMTDAENTKRQSIPLTPEQWEALERIAAETNSTADRGPTTGHPSWRALLRRIADGELIVTEEEK